MAGTCKVTRYGGWSADGQCREMSALEMLNWMSKNGYKLAWKRDRKDGGLNMEFRKPNCKTVYSVVYHK